MRPGRALKKAKKEKRKKRNSQVTAQTTHVALPPPKLLCWVGSGFLAPEGLKFAIFLCLVLCIFLDDTLTWSHQINTVYSKLMKYVGIFYKIRSKLPLSILRNIYFAFVYPHILYGIEIYADTSSVHLKKLITHVLNCRSKMLNVICALFSAVVKFVKFSCAHQNKYKAAGHV